MEEDDEECAKDGWQSLLLLLGYNNDEPVNDYETFDRLMADEENFIWVIDSVRTYLSSAITFPEAKTPDNLLFMEYLSTYERRHNFTLSDHLVFMMGGVNSYSDFRWKMSEKDSYAVISEAMADYRAGRVWPHNPDSDRLYEIYLEWHDKHILSTDMSMRFWGLGGLIGETSPYHYSLPRSINALMADAWIYGADQEEDIGLPEAITSYSDFRLMMGYPIMAYIAEGYFKTYEENPHRFEHDHNLETLLPYYSFWKSTQPPDHA